MKEHEKTKIIIDGKEIEIDNDFVNLIKELNRVGLKTTQCCQGGGNMAYLSIDMNCINDMAVRRKGEQSGEKRLVIWWRR